VSDPGGADLDRLLDPNLPHTFRGLDPEAVQGLLTDAVDSLRAAQRREEELRTTVAALEAELSTARAEGNAELDQARRRGRDMVNEAQLVRRRILEDLVRRRKVLRRQIEQLRVGRERLLEAYEVVGQTVEEATAELGVSLVAATAAAERAGRRLGPDDQVTDEDLHAMEAEINAARAAGLPILDPITPSERRAAAAAERGEEPVDEEGEPIVPPLVEVEPVVAAFEEMRVLGPVEGDAQPADERGLEVTETEPEAVEAPEPEAVDDVVAEPAPVADEPAPPEPEPEPEPEQEAVAEPAPEAPTELSEPEAQVLPLFDRLRAGPEPEPEPPLPDLIEAAPSEDAEDGPDPVAVLADDLARRLRRVLADEQNQVLDRLRQDRKSQLALEDLLVDGDARVVRLATAIEPQLREVSPDAADLAARLAGEVVDGVHGEITRQVGRATGDGLDLAGPVREAFRGWRTDRILPLAAAVAAEALGG
jgi:hypothetical protein